MRALGAAPRVGLGLALVFALLGACRGGKPAGVPTGASAGAETAAAPVGTAGRADARTEDDGPCGRVEGTIFLSSHAEKEVPGVSISIHRGEKVVFNTVTDNAGTFRSPCLPHGRYRVAFEKQLTVADFSGLDRMADALRPSLRVPGRVSGEIDEEISRPQTQINTGLINDP